MGFRYPGLRVVTFGALVAIAGISIPTALVVATDPGTAQGEAPSFTAVQLPTAALDRETVPAFASRLPSVELADAVPALASKGSGSAIPATAITPPAVTTRPAGPRLLAATAIKKVAKAKSTSYAKVSGVRARIVQIAMAQRGDRYVSGGTGPNSFDCSGLVRYAYTVAGVSGKLGGGHSASAMWSWGLSHGLVSRSNPRIGDVVIYGGGSHAAIYIGGGRVVSALNPSQGIRVTGLHALGAPFSGFIHTRI